LSGTINVAVLFGGRNTEHQVSCQSAVGVLRHLDRTRYRVTPVHITTGGVWVPGVDHGPPADASELLAGFPSAPASAEPLASIAEALQVLAGVDVVFPVLHGPFGEDGTMQGLLQMAGTPYVGSGVLASATAMDKEFTKKLLVTAGFEVADGVVVRPGDETVEPADRERLGLPVFVKPARGGSSIGVSRVDDWDDLAAALDEARSRDSKVLVEAAVRGREIDVAVLERADGTVVTAPALEIRIAEGREFFDYDGKYADPATTFIIPADLNATQERLLAEAAVGVFRALGCAGLLRADFFLTERDGRSVPVVNEVNTIPGLTSHSQYPQMWQAAGLSYGELLDELIATALASGHRPVVAAVTG
jgi:D-alanine-D-alanine ligase